MLAGALLFSAAPAMGHGVPVGDGNDSASALDLASVVMSHTKSAYKAKIVTFDAFANGVLAADGDLYLDLDLAGTKKFDYYVWVDQAAAGTTAKVFKVGRTRALGRAKVSRPNTKTVSLSIPRTLVKRTKKTAGFGARSRWQQPANAYGESTLLTDKTPRGNHRF